MQPKIEKYNMDIQDNRSFNEKTKTTIENLQRLLEDNMQKIITTKSKNAELLDEEEKLT